MSIEVKGIIAAMVTSMNDDESINEAEICRQVERHIEAGANGVFCLGTNGEAYILDEEEKIRVIKTVVRQVNGRVPVYAGTGCPGTKATIRLSQIAADCGADVLSVISPYFAAISQEEIIDHYTALAQAVKCPIVMYNMPARTGNNIAPDTVAALSKVDGIVGIKDSSGNFDNMLQYIERTRKRDFAVLSGNDSLILWTLLAGGKGGVAGCANVFPKNMVAIYRRFMEGDMTGAREAQDAIRPFRDCFRFGNPNTIVKAAVAMLGYPVGKCRAPFNRLSSEGEAAVRKALDMLQAKGVC